jgi:heme oxygenase
MTLRELTQAKHDIADKLPFLNEVFERKVTKERYLNYLVQMEAVYRILEFKANEHGLLKDFPGIERTRRIEEDMLELTEEVNTVFSLFEETKSYCSYLMGLNDPKKIMAHVYVRHMGDLFGGQTLKTRVPGSAKWFQFENTRDLIMKIRAVATPDLADEANVAFDYSINILRKLS